MRKFDAESRKGLQDTIPIGLLGLLKTPTRAGEMAYKISSNTTLTSHAVHKWAHRDSSISNADRIVTGHASLTYII